MPDRGFDLTRYALLRQLAALPAAHYLLRLIGAGTRQCQASRIWSPATLAEDRVVAFLRARNGQGCDVYFRPWAGDANAGYLLLDFDTGPCPLKRLRDAGHEPCVVVETSPGRQQAWFRVGTAPVDPAAATRLARELAARYGADPASAEGLHLGRLAGFTNRKCERRDTRGLAPWVRIVWTAVAPSVLTPPPPCHDVPVALPDAGAADGFAASGPVPVYRQWLKRAGVYQPITDWSVADYRVACALLRAGAGMEAVVAVLRQGSPGFPRRHGNPGDYLSRTVRRAALHNTGAHAFSAAPER